MLFFVRFTDNPERLAIRNEFLPAHLAWLEKHQDIVRVAGSLRPEVEAAPIGAARVVEAKDRKEIESLLKSDPFWAQGLHQSVQILHWSKAFPKRTVPV